MMDAEDMGQVMAHSMTHPKYLHSNSTSHVWAFGAIAELADNALDAGATKFSMDLVTTSQLLAHVKSEPGASRRSSRPPTGGPFVMTFQDNGKGMSPIELHKMLSFGHCDKDKIVAENGQVMPIGHYGNGFKSGSMRLGKDALVFTKCARTQSVGLLSQTFLAETHATEVLVPIVSWDNDTGEPISVRFARQTLSTTPISANQQLTEAFNANLKVITKFSPFESATALRLAFSKIQGTGTHIVVFNLRKPADSDEPCEFSLEDNSESQTLSHDIQLARCMWDEVTVAAGHSLSPINFSLREYMSILYLNPRMQIWIRGHKVQLRKLHYCLYKPRQYSYRPKSAEAEPVTITMGFNMFSEKEHFGMMLYHRDRLIKYFLHVGYQLSPDSRGVGVIGVLNVNALQPTHNKQSFIMDNNYRLLVNNLKDQLARYWKAIIGNNTLTLFWNRLARAKESGKMCVQCSKCMKWRIVLERGDVPELWECRMRSEISCDEPETLPPIPPLSKPGRQPLTDVERKLEEQIVKIEKRHKDMFTKLRAVKAKELATATGFPLDKCVAALRVSSDNKDLAAELLFSNKPIPGFDFEIDDEAEFDRPLRRSQRQANAIARVRDSDDEVTEEPAEEGEEQEEEEDEDDAARDDYDDENGGSSRRKKKRRRSSASSSSSKKSKQQKKMRKKQKRASASHGLAEVDSGNLDLEDSSDLTERERRRRERELHKQRMLEERLLGRDSSSSSTSSARDKGKEVHDEDVDGEDMEEEEEEDETLLRRRRNKKKSRTTSRGSRENTDDDDGEGGEEEEDEDEDNEPQENGHYDADEDGDDCGTRVRPFGSSVDRCERCEDMERELKRQEESVASLQRRVRELEEQLQLTLRTNGTTSATPVVDVATTIVQVKKEPNTATTSRTTAAAAEEEGRLPIFGAGTETRPYVLAAVKNEPDPYEFIEFI